MENLHTITCRIAVGKYDVFHNALGFLYVLLTVGEKDVCVYGSDKELQ